MKKYFLCFVLILLILTGCNSDEVNSPIYKGKNLNIGVIGKSPKVREENIRFTNITFNELENIKKDSTDFDAMLIMKENLSHASESEFADVYKNLRIPVLFIQTKKSFTPFIYKDLSYKDVPDTHDQTYATGILFSNNEKMKGWGFGLYNDKVNEANIKDVYTRIFTEIESIEK